jgi:hypothetical protein
MRLQRDWSCNAEQAVQPDRARKRALGDVSPAKENV